MGLGLAIGAGIGQAVAGLAGSVISGEYQKGLQEDQQTFIKDQSQNQIKYNVQQMKDLGYSPSMLFGGNTPSGGGAGGGGMGKAPDFATPILQAINTIGNLWMRDKELDNKEKSLANNERYIDLLENKAVNENAANTAKALKYAAQEQYWNQRYYNMDKNHPLNTNYKK